MKKIYWRVVPAIAVLLLVLTVVSAIQEAGCISLVFAGGAGWYLGILVEHYFPYD